MSITDTTVREPQATDPDPEQQRRRPSRRVGVLIGVPVALLGAVAATTLALGAGGADRPADGPTRVVPDPPAAYQPGGSVHDAQVPDLADRPAGPGSGRYLDLRVPQPGPRILVP